MCLDTFFVREIPYRDIALLFLIWKQLGVSVVGCSHMMDYLADTNPSLVWLRQRFAIHLPTASGEHIVVRFDLKSCGDEGFKFDTDKVCAHFEHMILADPTTQLGEYLSVAATIADVLNQMMDRVKEEVLWQFRMSYLILDALASHNMSATYLLTNRLGYSLLAYDPLASQVWSDWVGMVYETIKADNEPGFGLDVVI